MRSNFESTVPLFTLTGTIAPDLTSISLRSTD